MKQNTRYKYAIRDRRVHFSLWLHPTITAPKHHRHAQNVKLSPSPRKHAVLGEGGAVTLQNVDTGKWAYRHLGYDGHADYDGEGEDFGYDDYDDDGEWTGYADYEGDDNE